MTFQEDKNTRLKTNKIKNYNINKIKNYNINKIKNEKTRNRMEIQY